MLSSILVITIICIYACEHVSGRTLTVGGLLIEDISTPYPTVPSKSLAAAVSWQPNNLTASNVGSGSVSGTSPTTTKPAYLSAGVCLVGYCTGSINATKTVDESEPFPSPPEMLPDAEIEKDCVLWDDTCSGNKTAAAKDFFGTVESELLDNSCFHSDEADSNLSEDCQQIETPGRLSEFEKIRNWMRSPQCLSERSAYSSSMMYNDLHDIDPSSGGNSCCGICQLVAKNVDIYYWPEPNANTSCLSVIGTDVNDPFFGATSTVNPVGYSVYWGCTAQGLTSGPPTEYVTTAAMTVISSISVKVPLINPWSPLDCVGSTPAPLVSIATTAAPGPSASIFARGHSLIGQPGVGGNASITTAIVGTYTL